MIHHPVLIVLHGVLPAEQFRVAVYVSVGVFAVAVVGIWVVFFCAAFESEFAIEPRSGVGNAIGRYRRCGWGGFDLSDRGGRGCGYESSAFGVRLAGDLTLSI
jgi:hypothetical protein